MNTIIHHSIYCAHCQQVFSAKRSNRRYCSSLCRNRAKYARLRSSGKAYRRKGKEYLHRFIYKQSYGIDALPDGFDIHHLDNDPLNNNHENLLAIPHNLHSRLRHLVKKGHKIGLLLFPAHILRATLYYRKNPHFGEGLAV
jgi:hypothetical protein